MGQRGAHNGCGGDDDVNKRSRGRVQEEQKGKGLGGTVRGKRQDEKREGGRREDTLLLEGLGVWAGLGLDLKPDTQHTNTPG